MRTLGCDPELFVYNKKVHEYMSSAQWIKGTKDKPFKVDGGATQVDGVAAEFNIDPVDNVEDWVKNIDKVINALYDQLPNSDFTLIAIPVATFDPIYFDTLSPEEKALGCMPDYNAYTGEQNHPPSTNQTFRTGSGHVHVSCTSDKNEVIARVKQLDGVLFLSSLLYDRDSKRRTLYGKPGAFRFKDYGFEYRPLSNEWVDDEELQRWVFNATNCAMDLYDEGTLLFNQDNTPPSESYDLDSLKKYHLYIHQEYGIPILPERYM